jgi:RIO kinase 1
MKVWAVDALLDDDLELDEAGRPARARKRVARAQPNRDRRLADMVELRREAPGAGVFFRPSLTATDNEMAWIIEHLEPFHTAKVLTDVTRRVKGGKEATVYVGQAHPQTGLDWMAVKLYRPRQFRSLKDTTQYQQGRAVLNAAGQAVGARDWRLHKAIAGKTRKGLMASQTSWLEYEYQTLLKLHQAGADVPEPFKHSTYVLLMEYIGDETMPAPTLVDVALSPDETPALFEHVLHNVELLLAQGWVHGDLSAYNILYWQGAITLIDFPQVVEAQTNPDARALFNRDVERVCAYFARYGVRSRPRQLAHDLWARHVG